MSKVQQAIKQVVIAVHPKMQGVTELAGQIGAFLEERSVSVYVYRTNQEDLTQKLETKNLT